MNVQMVKIACKGRIHRRIRLSPIALKQTPQYHIYIQYVYTIRLISSVPINAGIFNTSHKYIHIICIQYPTPLWQVSLFSVTLKHTSLEISKRFFHANLFLQTTHWKRGWAEVQSAIYAWIRMICWWTSGATQESVDVQDPGRKHIWAMKKRAPGGCLGDLLGMTYYPIM